MFNAQWHRRVYNSQKVSDTDILKIKDEGVITKRTTVSKQRENSDAVYVLVQEKLYQNSKYMKQE